MKVVRYRGDHAQWKSLTEQDHATLDVILQNEADMAYRRRARILMDYLELKDGERVFDCGCGMGFYLMTMGKLRRLKLAGLDGDGGAGGRTGLRHAYHLAHTTQDSHVPGC